LSDEKKLSIAALSLEVFTQHLTPDFARAIHLEVLGEDALDLVI
jgi:hypothetical protein